MGSHCTSLLAALSRLEDPGILDTNRYRQRMRTAMSQIFEALEGRWTKLLNSYVAARVALLK